MPTPTIDFEVYLNTNAPAAERQAALVELFANEDAAGIEYAVVMPSPTPRLDNRSLYDTAGSERRAILCCQVNPNYGAAAFDKIRQAATDWGMRVLKIMPAIYHVNLTGPLASELMTTARELRLVVNIHSGSEISHPLAIGALARRFPDVTVLMDHMGYREWVSEAIEAARDNPNLYLGTITPCTCTSNVASGSSSSGGASSYWTWTPCLANSSVIKIWYVAASQPVWRQTPHVLDEPGLGCVAECVQPGRDALRSSHRPYICERRDASAPTFLAQDL